MIEKERFWNPRDYKPRNSLQGPYLVVCALLKAFRCISPSYCSYCLTVYTPQYSLAYHSNLNRRYCGLKTFAVYVFDFSCPWKESTIQKKPVLCLTSLNRRLNHFEFSFELGAYPRRSLILTSHLPSKDLKATGKLIFEFRHECIKTTRIQMLSFLPFQRDGSVSIGN